MKKLMAVSLTALCAGFLAGRHFPPEQVNTETPELRRTAEFSFAESAVKVNTVPEKAEILPDDLYIRLKNEAEKTAEIKAAAPASKPAQQNAPEPPFIEDSASKAHREASSGIKALESGNCAGASVHLEKAYSLKKDKNILSHYLLSLLLCGEAENAAEKAKAEAQYTDSGALADVIENAVKRGRAKEAAAFFKSLGITDSGKLLNSAGLAYEAAGEKERAAEMYKKAYLLSPENPFISFSRARAADMEGAYAEAVIFYEKTAASAVSAELKHRSVSRSAEIREHLAAQSPQTP
ncbi:MAG: hypothetical protein AB7E48_05685 [Deferribacterales bacterium]